MGDETRGAALPCARIPRNSRYRGRRVAIDPARGVIASGADIGEVIDQLDRMGIPRESDDVLLTVVPA
jgi:hypothetical protein